jgi:hypothetical protein
MWRVMSVLVLSLLTLIAMGCQRSTAPLNGCVEVTGTFNPAAPGFIVSYQSGVDPVTTTARLETKYTFSASHVYTALPGFSAQLSTAALSGIRCESTVSAITHDGVGTIANP